MKTLKWKDLNFRVHLEMVNSSVLGFKIYDLHSYDLCVDPGDSLRFRGDVRFDGCCNWDGGDARIHCCGLNGFKEITIAMDRIYQHAEKMIEGWCG